MAANWTDPSSPNPSATPANVRNAALMKKIGAFMFLTGIALAIVGTWLLTQAEPSPAGGPDMTSLVVLVAAAFLLVDGIVFTLIGRKAAQRAPGGAGSA